MRAHPSDRAGVPTGLSPAVSSEAAHPLRCERCVELYEALEEMVAWYAKRDNEGDDSLLPPDQQEGEIARAMQALAESRGEQA